MFGRKHGRHSVTASTARPDTLVDRVQTIARERQRETYRDGLRDGSLAVLRQLLGVGLPDVPSPAINDETREWATDAIARLSE